MLKMKVVYLKFLIGGYLTKLCLYMSVAKGKQCYSELVVRISQENAGNPATDDQRLVQKRDTEFKFIQVK